MVLVKDNSKLKFKNSLIISAKKRNQVNLVNISEPEIGEEQVKSVTEKKKEGAARPKSSMNYTSGHKKLIHKPTAYEVRKKLQAEKVQKRQKYT